MLTIRFIGMDGREVVQPIRSVYYNPPNSFNDGRDFLEVFRTENECEIMWEGTAFVMNENGKTVATYRLNSPPKAEAETDN